MNIVFFTEGDWIGRASRTHSNLRTDLAWQVALKSNHWPLEWLKRHKVPSDQFGRPLEEYLSIDIGIIILPKNGNDFTHSVESAKRFCKRVAVMQEGPNWLWQDYTPNKQADYFNALKSADFVLCHGNRDQSYYIGLLDRNDVYVMNSLMIEDVGFPTTKTYEERSGVIVGGNMTSWYNGFDSMVIANEFGEPISIPSMGRKQQGEEKMWPDVTYLKYMSWFNWIHKLNEFKYGVHLMRTFAAGTFALNCARLGIPCIGWDEMDTQRKLFPDLSPNVGDMWSAKKIANRLLNNRDFYNSCASKAQDTYLKFYSEKEFVSNMSGIFQEQLAKTNQNG